MASKQRPRREAKKPPSAKRSSPDAPCDHAKKKLRHVGWGVVCACGARIR